MSFTYDDIDMTWSQEFFDAKRKKLISLPAKFQVHIISRNTFFNVSKGGWYIPP